MSLKSFAEHRSTLSLKFIVISMWCWLLLFFVSRFLSSIRFECHVFVCVCVSVVSFHCMNIVATVLHHFSSFFFFAFVIGLTIANVFQEAE